MRGLLMGVHTAGIHRIDVGDGTMMPSCASHRRKAGQRVGERVSLLVIVLVIMML